MTANHLGPHGERMLDSEADPLRCLPTLPRVWRYIGSCADQRMRLDLVQVMASLRRAVSSV